MNGQQQAPVVMFHIGRSGSTVLADMLTQRDDLCWGHELYLPIFLKWNERQGRDEHGRFIDPVAYLDARLAEVAPHRYGFEVKFFHLARLGVSLPDFVGHLLNLGVKQFIVLRRRNILRKIVSSVIAHATTQYHASARERPKLHRVHLDINRIEVDFNSAPLLHFLEQYDADFAQLAQLLADHTPLALTYEEDVLPDPQRGYRRICHYLGLPPKAAVVQYGRTNPFPLQELVTNFDALATLLAPTPYAWMLNE